MKESLLSIAVTLLALTTPVCAQLSKSPQAANHSKRLPDIRHGKSHLNFVRRWGQRVPADIWPVVVSKDYLIAAGVDSMYCLNAETGAIRWRRNDVTAFTYTGAAIVPAPYQLLLYDDHQAIAALDVRTGKERYHTKALREIGPMPILIIDQNHFLTAIQHEGAPGSLVEFDIRSGKTVAVRPIEFGSWYPGYYFGPSQIVRNSRGQYILGDPRTIAVLQNGMFDKAPAVRNDGGNFAATDRRIVGSYFHEIVGFDYHLNVVWRRNIPAKPRGMKAPAYVFVHGNQALVYTWDRELICLNADTGRIAWRRPSSGFPCVSNGTIFTRHDSPDRKHGRLLAYRFSDGALLADIPFDMALGGFQVYNKSIYLSKYDPSAYMHEGDKCVIERWDLRN